MKSLQSDFAHEDDQETEFIGNDFSCLDDIS